MKEYITSNLTGKTYALQDVVRILNTQQIIAYMKYGVEILDIYPSINFNNTPVLVFIVNKKASKKAYDLWCKGELGDKGDEQK